MKKIAVIGAGTMGNGIAHVFALQNFEVRLLDVSEKILVKAEQTIETNLARQVKKEIISEENKESTLSNLKFDTKIEEGVKDADLVVEAITEQAEIKLNMFKKIDQICPAHTIFASNTSSISITKIGSSTNRPDKVIGMHFMNPVPVMQLVEIIKGYSTSEETAKKIEELTAKLNKTPVVVNDYPGFVANRILMPMINEAIIALQEGVGGVSEIDSIMKLGMSHPMGPLQLADFIGLDVCLYIMQVLHKGLGKDKYAPCPLLVNMVEAGHMGVKSGIGFYQWQAGSKDLIVAEQFRA